jgi:hypothetical protein
VTELAADIVIGAVEEKSGTSSSGRAWKLFKIAGAGTSFSTFDANLGSTARANQGRTAHITYKTTEKGNDLVTLVVDESSQAPVELVRDRNENGAADWDMIGLRKTRCALWVAAIGAGMDSPTARLMVIDAEIDIFHRQPAEALDGVPF